VSTTRAEFGLSVLAWCGFALALVAAYSHIGGDTFLARQLFNADALYLPALYSDIANGIPLNGWHLTPAPYFFPDMPAYFALHVASGDPRTALLLYGVVQPIALVAGLTLVANFLQLPRITHVLLVLGGGLFVLVASRAYVPFAFAIFQPATHFGGTLVTIFAFALVLKSPTSDSPAIPALLAVLSVLAVASDSLYLVQLAAPAVTGLVLLGVVQPGLRRRLLASALALLGGSVLGLVLGMNVLANTALRAYISFDAASLVAGTRALREWLIVTGPARAPALVATTLFLLVVSALAGLTVRQQLKGERAVPAALLLTLVFVPAAALSNLIAVAFAGRDDFERYIIPTMVIGSCFGWAMLVAWVFRTARAQRVLRRALVVGAAGILAVSAWNTSAQNLVRLANYYPPLVSCLDSEASARNLSYGISNYWQAKFVSVLSRTDLLVVQVTPELGPYYWINNKAWYDHEFEFMIIDETAKGWHRLDRAAIVARFGKPAETFRCDTSEVLVYTTSAFRTQFESRSGCARRTPPIWTRRFPSWKGCACCGATSASHGGPATSISWRSTRRRSAGPRWTRCERCSSTRASYSDPRRARRTNFSLRESDGVPEQMPCCMHPSFTPTPS
jgi:hypothetical protein